MINSWEQPYTYTRMRVRPLFEASSKGALEYARGKYGSVSFRKLVSLSRFATLLATGAAEALDDRLFRFFCLGLVAKVFAELQNQPSQSFHSE